MTDPTEAEIEATGTPLPVDLEQRTVQHHDKLDFVLDILRANQMHEGSCASRDTHPAMITPPCDCWISKESQ